MDRIALTGGTGFAGRCLINEILANSEDEVVSLQRHGTTPRERVEILHWDFLQPAPERVIERTKGCRYLLHLGADVHALRSVSHPGDFVMSNVLGTYHALELARKIQPQFFMYMSSGEVFGPRDVGYCGTDDPLRPSNPYAGSKAAGEMLVRSYFNTYDLPAIIVRTMNLYGADQTGEKFYPMVVKALNTRQPVRIHVDREGRPGVRQWIPGRTFVNVLRRMLPDAEAGHVYHVVGEELTNLEMAQRIADVLELELDFVASPMPSTHAWRYAMKEGR